jgi:hypothetical protein
MRRNHTPDSGRDERDDMETSPYLNRPLRTIEEAEQAIKAEMARMGYQPDPELFVHVPTPAGSLYIHKALLPKVTK